MAFNIRAGYRPGMATTEVDPFQTTQIGGVGDQLAALLNEEALGRKRKSPMMEAGPKGSSMLRARPARRPPPVADDLQRTLEREQVIMSKARTAPAPKKYVSVGGGSYLVDDWDRVPLAMRPNTQVIGYTSPNDEKAMLSAGDDLADALIRDRTAGGPGFGLDLGRDRVENNFDSESRRRQQMLNAGYGRY